MLVVQGIDEPCFSKITYEALVAHTIFDILRRRGRFCSYGTVAAAKETFEDLKNSSDPSVSAALACVDKEDLCFALRSEEVFVWSLA